MSNNYHPHVYMVIAWLEKHSKFLLQFFALTFLAYGIFLSALSSEIVNSNSFFIELKVVVCIWTGLSFLLAFLLLIGSITKKIPILLATLALMTVELLIVFGLIVVSSCKKDWIGNGASIETDPIWISNLYRESHRPNDDLSSMLCLFILQRLTMILIAFVHWKYIQRGEELITNGMNLEEVEGMLMKNPILWRRGQGVHPDLYKAYAMVERQSQKIILFSSFIYPLTSGLFIYLEFDETALKVMYRTKVVWGIMAAFCFVVSVTLILAVLKKNLRMIQVALVLMTMECIILFIFGSPCFHNSDFILAEALWNDRDYVECVRNWLIAIRVGMIAMVLINYMYVRRGEQHIQPPTAVLRSSEEGNGDEESELFNSRINRFHPHVYKAMDVMGRSLKYGVLIIALLYLLACSALVYIQFDSISDGFTVYGRIQIVFWTLLSALVALLLCVSFATMNHKVACWTFMMMLVEMCCFIVFGLILQSRNALWLVEDMDGVEKRLDKVLHMMNVNCKPMDIWQTLIVLRLMMMMVMCVFYKHVKPKEPKVVEMVDFDKVNEEKKVIPVEWT